MINIICVALTFNFCLHFQSGFTQIRATRAFPSPVTGRWVNALQRRGVACQIAIFAACLSVALVLVAICMYPTSFLPTGIAPLLAKVQCDKPCFYLY